MDAEVLVYADLRGELHRLGRLWARTRSGRSSASFEYDGEWLHSGGSFAIEPALRLGPGPFHTPANREMFGAIGDSAPDRWAVPTDIKPRVIATAIDAGDTRASLDLALGVAEYFELTADEARTIVGEVGQAAMGWRLAAASNGLTAGEIDRMDSAFNHDDLRIAVS